MERQGELAANTITAYASDVRVFESFMRGLGKDPIAATAEDVIRFLATPPRSGLWRARSAARRLSCLRGYFCYVRDLGLRHDNPTVNVQRTPFKRTAVAVLEQAELLALLNAPDVGSLLGMRDRAMLELTYRCALRVSEVIGLRYTDTDLQSGSITVASGDRKGRVIAVNPIALTWMKEYIHGGYAAELGSLAGNILFPSRIGRRMTRQAFWGVVRRAAEGAGIDRPLTPRMLRLTLASQPRLLAGSKARTSKPSEALPDNSQSTRLAPGLAQP